MNARATWAAGSLDELAEVLRREFDLARAELADAVRAQRRADTPAARRRVADCRSDVDLVLDVWNAALPTTPPSAVPAVVPAVAPTVAPVGG